MNDTIVAVSTALGEGAISIIRVSGDNAIKIVNPLFNGCDLTKVQSHTINYGHIIYSNEIIDEVLLSIMKAPKTYTKEDIIEINTHGSIAVVNKLMEILLLSGCRLAEPGEFTKRAFLNGRIDLTESEGVMDLINSETELTRKMAINEISGKISKLITDLRNKIVALISNIEVNIDYPEYEDAIVVTNNLIKDKILIIEEEINKLVDLSKNGLIIKNGINIAIVGKPNVGKSSILNALLGEDKAIVTNIKGTTRDIVEGTILLNGIEVNLYDTAGIRNTNEIVESIGIEKSIKKIDESDLVLFVIDSSTIFELEDKKVFDSLNNKNVLVVYNKKDLGNKKHSELDIYESINISSSDKKDIEILKNKISKIFNLDDIEKSDFTYISNARQISLLKKCLNIIEEIKNELENETPVDLVEINIREIWETLGEITGEVYKDELLDEIFSKFCLGK